MRNLLIGLAIACAVAGCQSKKEVVREITFLNWNVEHYCHGAAQVSTISEAEAPKLKAQYADFFKSFNADVIGLCEYSDKFSTNGTIRMSRDILGKYDRVIGPRRGTMRNALFFRGSKQAEKIVDYREHLDGTYYTAVKLDVDGVPVWFVQTHLDRFTYIAGHKDDRKQQMAQLIDDFKDEPNVVIAGDFRVGVRMPGVPCFPAPEEYDPFVKAGYMLANVNGTGTYPVTNPIQPIDNIIVKGCGLCDVRFVPIRELGDHLALSCKIQLFRK